MNLTEECHHQMNGEVTELARFSNPLLSIAAALTILIMVTGLFGNLLTIIALLKSTKTRNIASTFIISLCVADFAFCAFVLPFSASRFLNKGWVHGSFLCSLFPLMRYGNLGVSLLSITMITINRYMMITNNALYSRIYQPVWIGCMIGFCWVFSFLMQFPTLLGIWGRFGYDPILQTCTILPDTNGSSSKSALFVIAFVIPCIIIIFCYTRIFWTVHKSEKRMRRHAATDQPQQLPSRTITEGDAKTRSNEWRITKMVLIIFLSFVACYLPITIIKIADKCVNHPVMHVIGYILVYLSACVNPIIYVFMNKQYRQAFQAVLCSDGNNGFLRSYRVLFQTNKSRIPATTEQYSQTMVSRMSVTNAHFIPKANNEEQ